MDEKRPESGWDVNTGGEIGEPVAVGDRVYLSYQDRPRSACTLVVVDVTAAGDVMAGTVHSCERGRVSSWASSQRPVALTLEPGDGVSFEKRHIFVLDER